MNDIQYRFLLWQHNMKVCDYYIMKKNQQLEKILKQLKHVLEGH